MSEGIFFNYKHEDIDWNSLDEKQKDEYFYEFVAHYLPSGFIEALGSPIQLVITGLITVGLAITTGGASAVAQLELALAAAGLALTGMNVYGSIRGIMVANEMKEASTTMHEAKKAAKVMAESIAQLSLSVVDLLLTGKDLLKVRNKNVATVVDSVKKSPEEILQEAGYKKGKLIQDNVSEIEKLQHSISDEILINSLSKMKKQGIKKSIENIKKIEIILNKISIPYQGVLIENVDKIRRLQRYYSNQELIDILNNVSPENFEPTIKNMIKLQDKLLSKNISSGETNKFARELLTELELKHGITEERLNVLRNLDYNKMTQSDYEKIKPEIDAIISLTKSYDLNKVKPGMMRKYISVEVMNQYLANGKNSKSVGGFIARQDDVLQLKTFEDVFYTMRLDYEGNTFVYNREIAYIDFSATSYEDTFVPIGKLYEGTETTPSPFGGMGLLKTENNQIVREYKTKVQKL